MVDVFLLILLSKGAPGEVLRGPPGPPGPPGYGSGDFISEDGVNYSLSRVIILVSISLSVHERSGGSARPSRDVHVQRVYDLRARQQDARSSARATWHSGKRRTRRTSRCLGKS